MAKTFPSYIVNGNMASTVTGAELRVGAGGRLLLDISWGATGSPVGSFKLHGRTPDGATFREIYGSSSEFSVQPAGGAGAMLCSWRDLEVFRYVKLLYVPQSGGVGNTTLQVQARVI